MKTTTRNNFRFFQRLIAATLIAALPMQAVAAGVELATSPLATSTATPVKPNLMFVLDDSGSMAWDYLPDPAKNFAGKYGYNSSQCNGNYYNPSIIYSAPVDASGNPLNATATTFSAAYVDGYNTGAGTADLSTEFTGGSGSGSSGISLTPGPAFYYRYGGSQNTPAQKNYFNTSSTFYQECNSNLGSTPGSGVFTLVRMALVPTTKITVSGAGGATGATITITSISQRSKVSSVQVNGQEILNATTNRSSNANTVASNIAAGINACTSSTTGNCTVTGYSATSSGSVVTIQGPAAAAGFFPIVTRNSGDVTFSTTAFPALSTTTVSSISVSTTELLSANASGGTPNTLASDIRSKINANTGTSGYSATVSNNVVTVTGPTTASTLLPAITVASGTLTLTTLAFPESNSTNLQNFANWYSYYSNRMLMMKTGAGLAFKNVSDAFRVGFLTMNNNVSPGIVPVDTFTGAQKTNWYTKLYGSVPNNSTPLREVLSHVGQYYAHKFGDVTKYTARITVGGSGSTSVDSIEVNNIELLEDQTIDTTSTSALAASIADQINAMVITDFGASASGSVVTITGPATAVGFAPVVSKSGSMTLSATTFSGTTTTAQLNGITPPDPVQYSCQQNFTILSTDGYWNGPNTYNLTNGAVGQVDGLAPRPFNDGAQTGDTITITYSRNDYSTSGSGCGGSNRKLKTQPQQGSCSVNVVGTPTGSESCSPSNWTDNGSATFGSCVSSPTVPSPDPSVAVEVSRVVTPGVFGGTPDTLADVAMYYYQTDLRDNSLANCTGALGTSVCDNNVFISATDNNVQQHMTTFTLGLGVRGRMIYSSSYQIDTTGDFVAVKLGSTANAAPSTITVGGSGSTTVSSITVNGTQLMSGTSTGSTDVNTVAANIAARITQNGFTATASGPTVTVFGPSSAAGFVPVVTQSGSMTMTNATQTPVCTWQANGTVCNWPVPTSGSPETTDDLWHAAVNGHGAYFSATDPTSLGNGLANALVSIKSKVGAAAAAATSTLNPVAGNNQAFVASYTTLKWTGNLEARGINTDTGVVNENANWCVENVTAGTCEAPGTVISELDGDTTTYFCSTPGSTVCPGGTLDGTDCKVPVAIACTGTMNGLVTDTTDTRLIKTPNNAGTALINFDTAYRAAHPTYFDATLLAGLSQWPPVTDVSATADALRTNAPGDNLLKYLRGQRGHEFDRSTVLTIDQFYRKRDAVLGDALESQPAFMGAPVFSYPYPGYNEFKTAAAGRLGTVYMGTNDGMMHGFAADTGVERWGFIPSVVVPNLWKLADKLYADKHTNYVNGSPITSDVCTANCATAFNALTPSTNPVWKTILVAGLNGGGRGYYALDISDPTSPVLLWEFTTSAGIGTVQDNDLGYTYGQPVITRKTDGTWVVLVTSGYDNGTDSPTRVSGSLVANSPAGSGIGYLYVLNAGTGAIISKISTGVGTAATPSGLAKISGFNAEPGGGNRASFVYGGDLLGNLWRFDINSSTTATIGTGSAFKFATLFSDTAGTVPQPIMTTPVLGTIVGKRVIFIATGKYLETTDLSTTQKQTQYAIKDDDATATLVNPRNGGNMVQQYLINNPDGTATRLSAATATATTSGSNAVDFGINRGWFVDLPESRERVNIDGKLIEGTLLVPSIVPSATDCSPGGSGWLNFFDYRTGAAVVPTSGIASSKYDSPIVGVNVLYIDGNPVVEVVTSTKPTPEKDPTVQFKATAAGFAGKRVLWRELIP